MTRAKDRLALCVPQRFYTHHQPSGGDRHVYAARSRFIPDSILPLFRDDGLATRGNGCRRHPPILSRPRRRGGSDARHVEVSAYGDEVVHGESPALLCRHAASQAGCRRFGPDHPLQL
jgi:hypothetical protein